tara:strand:- start:267 stop:1073 length:807 start_codon:yes stop_codon:yes gene_type:complete
MAEISGVPTADINNVDGFFTTQGGGGTATTTPTLGTIADAFSSFTCTITNFASYTNAAFSASVFVGATEIISNANITNDGNGVLSWTDLNATVGQRTLKVRAQEFGNFVQSAEATQTYNKSVYSYRYFYLYLADSSGNISANWGGVRDWVYTDADGTTRRPAIMTSQTTPAPYVASSGHINASYQPYEAFDGSTSTSQSWISIGLSAASQNWLKIDMGAQTTMSAGQIMFYSRPLFAYIEGSNDDVTYTPLHGPIDCTAYATSYFTLL